MPRHSEALVTSIKQAIDLVTLVGEYLPLQRSGSKYKVLCPFHDDHNPSLELNPERQSFKCWACGAGGDIFDFVQKYERVEFSEALRMLAERAGIPLSPPKPKSADDGPTKPELLAACAWAERTFAKALTHSSDSQAYLRERGIHPDMVDRFRLGYAPDARDWLADQARRNAIPATLLEHVGLTTRAPDHNHTKDRFRGRLIFPIHDWQGRPIAFGGRVLPAVERRLVDSDLHVAKYINSPETPLFQKRRSLYAAHLARASARQDGWVAVVEGYTDVVAAHQVGLTQVVGTLGTALGDEHVAALRRLAPRVILVFDGDEAGQKAAERSIEFFLGHEIDARVLALPAGLDPCDFLLKQGADAFRALLAQASDPIEFALARATTRHDLSSAEGVRLASEWLLGLLARLPRQSRSGLDLKHAKALDTISRRLGVPVPTLNRRLRALKTNAATPLRTSAVHTPTPASPSKPAPAPIDPLESELARIVLNQPNLLPQVAERVPLEEVHDSSIRAVLSACYELDAEGQNVDFERIASRLADAERSLAAGLLLPHDPQPSSGWVRAAAWDQRLRGALDRFDQRRRTNRLQALRRALQNLDPAQHAAEYETLRREFLLLHQQRPDIRKSSVS